MKYTGAGTALPLFFRYKSNFHIAFSEYPIPDLFFRFGFNNSCEPAIFLMTGIIRTAVFPGISALCLKLFNYVYGKDNYQSLSGKDGKIAQENSGIWQNTQTAFFGKLRFSGNLLAWKRGSFRIQA